MLPSERAALLTCAESPAYFAHHAVRIYDALAGAWIPFTLWPAQVRTLQTIQRSAWVVLVKARQLGMSWAVLGYALWLLLFRPAATVLIFSRRQEEAWYLLDRLRGMFARLPAWAQAATVTTNNAGVWGLSNGSVARAFPTSAGDSYTATLVIADEFDLVEDQDRLLRAVKPTIDAGGQIILLSRVDKRRPLTPFKRIYTAAKTGATGWTPIFLPWHARPDRDAAWYAAQAADIQARTGALDDLWEQYPGDDSEALAPRALDKRLPAAWVRACYQEGTPVDDPQAPPLGDVLTIYEPPLGYHRYACGADPAEGNPTSDTSAALVVDVATGAEVARLGGQLEPTAFAHALSLLSAYYHAAPVLPERNNHGHAVIAALRDAGVAVLAGTDGRAGWLTTAASKARLYDGLAAALRAGDAGIRSLGVYLELVSIEGSTLRAPEGTHDDYAVAYALAQQARTGGAVVTDEERALAGMLAAAGY